MRIRGWLKQPVMDLGSEFHSSFIHQRSGRNRGRNRTRGLGHQPALEAPDYNHFEMCESIGNPYGPNGLAALKLMKLA
jgi:hypothetical protein